MDPQSQLDYQNSSVDGRGHTTTQDITMQMVMSHNIASEFSQQQRQQSESNHLPFTQTATTMKT